MSAIIEGASIPAEMESVASSLSNKQIEELGTTRVVFFAGNDVTFTEKNEMASVKGFGGVYMPHLKTLPKANKGMIYRCQFTPLKTSKIIENRAMLPQAVREGGAWESGFIQSNAVRNPDGTYSDKEVKGFQASDPAATKKGQFANVTDTSQVFKNRYPGTDVRQAVRRSVPHGPGGVVEITALKGADQSEIHAAQLFFFPDWHETRKGNANYDLPTTIRELETHIKLRMGAIKELPVSLHEKYRSIGGAMLKSCTEFRTHYMATFQKNEIIMKDSAAKGNTGAAYPESAEQAMEMLEYRRKDDLVSGDSSSVDRLARTMEEDRKAQSERDTRTLLLEERKQYVAEVTGGFREKDEAEEIRLGLKKAEVARSGYAAVEPIADVPSITTVTPPIEPMPIIDMSAEVLPEVQPETVTNAMKPCGKPTANGECGRQIDELEDACWQHK